MNKKPIITCLLMLLVSLYSLAQTTGTVSPLLNLGGKEWKLKFKDENNDSKILEYVTNNESIEKWSELLTIQKFKFKFPKEVTPLVFAEKELASLKEKGYRYTSNTFDTSPTETTMEFRILSPTDQQQDEIQRIVKTKEDQLVVLHYAIRKADMGEAERTKWVSVLKGINTSDL